MTREDLLGAMAADAIRAGSIAQAKKIEQVKHHIEKHAVIEEQAQAHLLEAARMLNMREAEFFSQLRSERFTSLNAIKTPSVVSRLFADALSIGSYPSNMRMLIGLAKLFGPTSVTTIQSSAALSPSDRKGMMKDLSSEKGSDIVLFQTSPSLLGGLRIFHDERMIDKSVRGRITQLFQSI